MTNPPESLPARAWSVTLKGTAKGTARHHIVVRADWCTPMEIGLCFRRGEDWIVLVVPYGAFSLCEAIHPETGEPLHDQ